MFGKDAKQEALTRNLSAVFETLQRKHKLVAGDFPNPDVFRQCLQGYKFSKFSALEPRLISTLNDALAHDFPRIMSRFPQDAFSPGELDAASVAAVEASNPFSTPSPGLDTTGSPASPMLGGGQITPAERQTYMLEFQRLCPSGRLSGLDARPVLEQTGLPQETLAQIWRLADWDGDGALDAAQYAVAMFYANYAKRGGELPDQLPAHMAPTSMRTILS